MPKFFSKLFIGDEEFNEQSQQNQPIATQWRAGEQSLSSTPTTPRTMVPDSQTGSRTSADSYPQLQILVLNILTIDLNG